MHMPSGHGGRPRRRIRRMDTTKIFDVSYWVPHLTSSGYDTLNVKVESIGTPITTKRVGNKVQMCQEYVYGV